MPSSSPFARFHRLLLLLVAPLLYACGSAGPEAPAPGLSASEAAETITAVQIGQKIDALAHDSMAGRDTPSPELEQAATYLADQLAAAGLEPAGEDGSYVHRYEWTVTRLDPAQTFVGVEGTGDEPAYGVDYFMVPPPEPVDAGAYWVGVAGEAGPPPPEARGRILVYRHPGTELDRDWQMRLMAALQGAAASRAPGMLVILDEAFPPEAMAPLADISAGQQAGLAVVGISHEAGARLLDALGADLGSLEAAGEPAALGETELALRGGRAQETHTPPNVVAMLPGSDPALADSYVVLTAHFDHVGVSQRPDASGDSIFNGADDDASGTAAVVEIAEAFGALGRAPARSVVFLLVSGEEHGLLGSRGWVDDPTIPLDAVVANINMDMVGRNAPDTVIGIGQEYSSLGPLLDSLTAAHPALGLNVILDPKPEEMYFFRSDQLPFIQQEIPAVFFTTGDHEDYHQPSDEPEKIDDDKAARIARLGFYLAHAIASSETAPEWTEEGWQKVQALLGGSPF